MLMNFVGCNLNYSNENVTTTNDNLIRNAINQTPDVPVKDANGNWGGSSEQNIYGAYATNPIADALRIENKNKRTQLVANAYVDIKIIEGLTFRNEVGANLNYGNSYYFKPTKEYGYYTDNVNSSERSANNGFWWIVKNLLYYDKTSGKHHLGAMLAHEAQESNWENLSGKRDNFPLNTIHELNAGDEASSVANSGKGSSAIESYFGRLNYSFAEKYLATFTYRADGSSKFGTNNKWAYFPSAAIAWRINNESFMKEIKEVNNLKLRLSWGKVGNQFSLPNYAYLSTLRPVQTFFGTGFLSENIANPDLKWETTESYNVGVDLNLFGNRIEFIADAYVKNTDDLIIQLPLPAYSGTSNNPYGTPGTLATPYVNIGSIQNKGFELTLNTVNIDARSFRWRSGITFTLNRGTVKSLNTESSTLFGYAGSDILTLTQVGGPIGRFYGYVAEGLFISEADFYSYSRGEKIPVALPENEEKAPNGVWVGDIKWKDVVADGVINEKDRTFIGDPNPDFTYGFTNTFSYKDFDMTVDLQGVYGNDIYSGLRQSYEMPSGNFGLLRPVIHYAQIGMVNPDLPDANSTLSNVYVKNQGYFIPRITNDNANSNNRISSKFIEDGSYLRVKNISLGYNVPKSFLNKYNFESLRVYANIQNLFTFTKYSGYDPEVGGGILVNSYDNGRYPSPRIYTFGLNIGF
jgi:TonB-linked SusC/RagA family outer membrane protein